MLTVGDVCAFLERFAPLESAGDWDNVGLLLGSRAQPVERILTCLTVTPESAAEAIAERCQLIVSHHPIFFKPVRRLTDAAPEGRMLLALARAGIAVYSPHSAFDNASDGINHLLAGILDLHEVQPLRLSAGQEECKVVVFVPEGDLAKVMESAFAAGAGRIGQYRECSFRTPGTGTFFGGESTNPAVGLKGRREEVAEWRLEVLCPGKIVTRVLQAIRAAHSYEEPAIDVVPLRAQGGHLGEGRIGRLPAARPLQELAHAVRQELHCGPVQYIGEANQAISTVAVACGAGASFLIEAAAMGADCLLTGEARFHDGLEAKARGIALLLPGHYATERLGAGHLATVLVREFPTVTVKPSAREADPVHWA